MKCHETRHRIDLFMDGELSVEENFKVLEHLNLCRSCAEAFEAEKALREGLRAKWNEKAPPELAGRIRAKMGRRPLPWWVPGAAATVLVALFFGLVLRQVPSQQAFAASAVEYHEASRRTPAGPSACLRQCCCQEAEKRVRDLAQTNGCSAPCVHDLDELGYAFRSASVQTGPRVLCWTQQQNASGQLVSHTLVAEKLADEPMKMWDVNGRTLLLFSKPDGFT